MNRKVNGKFSLPGDQLKKSNIFTSSHISHIRHGKEKEDTWTFKHSVLIIPAHPSPNLILSKTLKNLWSFCLELLTFSNRLIASRRSVKPFWGFLTKPCLKILLDNVVWNFLKSPALWVGSFYLSYFTILPYRTVLSYNTQGPVYLKHKGRYPSLSFIEHIRKWNSGQKRIISNEC